MPFHEGLVKAGVFDSLVSHRRAGVKRALSLLVEQDMAELPDKTSCETMLGGYAAMTGYPNSHLMVYLRHRLPSYLARAEDLEGVPDAARIAVCG